jgi:hypothetical protein
MAQSPVLSGSTADHHPERGGAGWEIVGRDHLGRGSVQNEAHASKTASMSGDDGWAIEDPDNPSLSCQAMHHPALTRPLNAGSTTPAVHHGDDQRKHDLSTHLTVRAGSTALVQYVSAVRSRLLEVIASQRVSKAGAGGMPVAGDTGTARTGGGSSGRAGMTHRRRGLRCRREGSGSPLRPLPRRGYCSLWNRVSASVKNRSAASAGVISPYWTWP